MLFLRGLGFKVYGLGFRACHRSRGLASHGQLRRRESGVSVFLGGQAGVGECGALEFSVLGPRVLGRGLGLWGFIGALGFGAAGGCVFWMEIAGICLMCRESLSRKPSAILNRRI